LEYAPDYVKKYFDSLPENDPRKYYWRGTIETIIESNDEAIVLVKAKSWVLNSNEKLLDFVQHASLFKALWGFVVDETSLPAQGRGKLMTPIFPDDLDNFLDMEIKKREDALAVNSSRTQSLCPRRSADPTKETADSI
jgi:hypothetical protein